MRTSYYRRAINYSVSDDVIHFGSKMEEVNQNVFLKAVEEEEDISDGELIRAVEQIEQQQSGGGVSGGGVSGSGVGGSGAEGYFNFKRTQFREKTAKTYGIKRTSLYCAKF